MDSCTLTDGVCQEFLSELRTVDDEAKILPETGLPSQNDGICTIVLHGLGSSEKKLKTHGLESGSPLANAGLIL